MKSLTLGEASRRSGIAPRTLKRAVAEGRLPASRVDGWVYQIAPDDLASFALACQVEEMSSSAGRRAYAADRPRAAAPPPAPRSGLLSLFRSVAASLWPARIAAFRPSGPGK
ncbi:MAG: hypothetical protein IT534_02745 [Bauldia sp.]|nr:hypothetical protein [Bauldia sp.]